MSDQPLEQPVVIDGVSLVRGHAVPTHQADDDAFSGRLRQTNARSLALAMGADRSAVGVIKWFEPSIGQRTGKKPGPAAKKRKLNRF